MSTAEELIFKLDQIRERNGLTSQELSQYAGLSSAYWTLVYRRKGCDLKTLIRCAEVVGYHLELVRDDEA